LPDSAGNTVILLTQISQQLDSLSKNGTHAPIEASFLQSRFKPPASAVLVNVLWFLSLVISLFCALLATLQHRWARQYLLLTHPHFAIHKRARIRSFLAEGVDRFRVAIVVEAIPALLHVSVFLFLAGLVISLFDIHPTVAYVALAATAVCALVYAVITVLPAFWHDSPYTTPFSALAWYIRRKITTALLNVVEYIANTLWKYSGRTWRRPTSPLYDIVSPYKAHFSEDMTTATQDAALGSKWEIDARALGWTLNRLDEEGELVQFAAGIPRFSRSKVEDAVSILEAAPKHSILHTSLYRQIVVLLIRASKPGLLRDSKRLPESVRQQRTAICLEALYFLPQAMEKILARVASTENEKVINAFSPILQSADSWLVADRLSKECEIHRDVKIGARCVAAVLATQPPEIQTLPILVRQLNIKEPHILHDYLEHLDDLLLRNLNHFLRYTALDHEFIGLEKIDIIFSTVRLLIKRLRIEHAKEELRDDFERLRHSINLRARTKSLETNIRKNANRLLEELSSLPKPPGQSSNWGRGATTVSIMPALPSQASSHTHDTYISMPSPTCYPSTL
jgi:hypothetical protein